MKTTDKAEAEIRAIRRGALRRDIKGAALLLAWVAVGWGLESIDNAPLLAGLLWLSIFANGLLWLALNDQLTRAKPAR